MRILLALLAIMLLPAAQALTVSEPQPLPALVPDETYAVAFNVTVPCSAVIQQALPGAAATLTVTPSSPGGFFVSGPTSYLVSREGCVPTESRVVDVTFNLTASMEAPARQQADISFDIQLGDDPEEAAELVMPAVPAFKVIFEASTMTPVKQAGPQKTILYDIIIEYTANDRVRFMFASNGTDVGTLILPEPAIGDGGSGTLMSTARYATPYENGPNSAKEAFQVSVEARSEYEDTTFATQDVAFTANTKGVYVPGPTALLPIGLLVAALIRRR